MKVCIATGFYYEAGETQVNHHIASLFAGNTIVLTRKSNGKNPFRRPLHVWSARPKGLGALMHVVAFVRQMARERSAKVATDKEVEQIVNFLIAEKPDVLLAEFGHHALPVYRAAVAAKVPFFVYFRGADASKHLRKMGRAASYRKMLEQAAGIFAVSQFLLDELALRGVSHQIAGVIPSGVDTELVLPENKVGGRYIFVGRFVQKKRPLLALEAFSGVAKQNSQAHLRMIGTGPLLHPCQERAEQLGLTDRVTFLGQLEHRAALAELAVAQFLLLPCGRAANGDTEGLPMVIQEALAAGNIVVSTCHAGIPEAVTNGVTGILAPEDNDAAFFEAAKTAAALSIDRMHDMSTRARTYAISYLDQAMLIAKLENSIRDMLIVTEN